MEQNHMSEPSNFDEFYNKYRRYLSLSVVQLQRELDRQHKEMPEMLRNEILNAVKAEKKRLRSAQAQKKTRTALWRELMHPLNIELRTVVNMARYISKAYKVPERTKAVLAYRAVLEKLKRLVQKYQDQHATTPSRLAKEKNVPNDGAHWTDWVPLHVRAEIVEMFDAIPKNYKAKTKTPFERREASLMYGKKRRKLSKAVEQELHAAYKDLANEPREFDNADHHAYIARLELAKKAVIALAEDDYIPDTWQALFTNGSV
jgi:hypothetical protein